MAITERDCEVRRNKLFSAISRKAPLWIVGTFVAVALAALGFLWTGHASLADEVHRDYAPRAELQRIDSKLDRLAEGQAGIREALRRMNGGRAP